jgi:plasmid segregation protein ParM
LEVKKMFIGADGGNYETKIVTPTGAFKFRSCLGEYRDFQMDKGALSTDDIVWEYSGKRGFAGTLAESESLFVREMAGDTKAHEDAVIRILIAIHRFGNDSVIDLIVGQPIKKHKADKQRIIDMLKKEHTITVNGITKSFNIRNVNVAPEGAAAFWCLKENIEKVRIIDCGSGTINLATIADGRFIDRDSWTLTFGANSQENYETERLAEAIIASSSKRWGKGDCVRLCGGIAEFIKPYLSKYFTDIQVIRPFMNGKFLHPGFANAAGFYELARDLYA